MPGAKGRQAVRQIVIKAEVSAALAEVLFSIS